MTEPRAVIKHAKAPAGVERARLIIKDFMQRKVFDVALRDLIVDYPSWFEAVGRIDSPADLKAMRTALRAETLAAVNPEAVPPDRVMRLAKTGEWTVRGREARIAVLAALIDFKMDARMKQVAAEREADWEADDNA